MIVFSFLLILVFGQGIVIETNRDKDISPTGNNVNISNSVTYPLSFS